MHLRPLPRVRGDGDGMVQPGKNLMAEIQADAGGLTGAAAIDR